MLPSLPADYRLSSEDELVAGLRAADGLALAEAYHRTSHAAYACARRFLTRPDDVDALLYGCYRALWQDPPEAEQLEGWLRRRSYEQAVDWLRSTQTAPAAASVHELLGDVPAPAGRMDPLEQALARMDSVERSALLQAHYAGRRTNEQRLTGATAALRRALARLADPEAPDAADLPCELPELADWVLGLVSREEAARISADAASDKACAALTRVLQRGRRRLESLPPTPDTGQRIIAAVLSDAPATNRGAVAAGALAAHTDATSGSASVDESTDDALTVPPEPGEHTQPWRLSDLLATDAEIGPDPDADITPPPMLDDEVEKISAEPVAEPADEDELPSAHTFDDSETDMLDTSQSSETATLDTPPSDSPETVVRIRTDGADEAPADVETVEEDAYDIPPGPTMDDEGFGEPYEARRGGRWGVILGFLLLLALGVVAGLVLGPALVNLLL
ncbi:MAG: RNA polymerase sigma factor [Egibacteraceae bacterium]